MTTNEDLCTSLEASKLLAETGLMAGVEADAYYKSEYKYTDGAGNWTEFVFVDAEYTWHDKLREEIILSYRLDKILAVLPDLNLKLRWHNIQGVHIEKWYCQTEPIVLDDGDVHEIIDRILFKKGQAAANAAAELAHLLWKEGLIEK